MVEEKDKIEKLLENNQQTLASLDKRLHKIERKMKMDSVLGIIKWTLIVVPIVFGIIYISPYVKRYAPYLEPALKLFNLNTTQEGGQFLLTDEQKSVICDPKQRAVLVGQICK